VKRYTVSKAREQLADLLDEADRTGAVVIERRDVRYVIRPERPRQRRRGRSVIEIVDPAVADGQWHWTLTSKGIRFHGRRTRS
jgi:hypothetical protein